MFDYLEVNFEFRKTFSFRHYPFTYIYKSITSTRAKYALILSKSLVKEFNEFFILYLFLSFSGSWKANKVHCAL